MPYKLSIVIGRFEPPHLGHCFLFNSALNIAERTVILVGSTEQARNIKNPWTFEERKEMIYACLTQEQQKRTTILPVLDHMYEESKWVEQVQAIIADICDHENIRNEEIVLVGHKKDASSDYLDTFPQWKFIDTGFIDNPSINATKVRELFFEDFFKYSTGVLAPAVVAYLQKFQATPVYTQLKEEYDFIKKYKESWASSPYPPTHVTVDAVVVQSGHVLVVQRRCIPGKGLLAMPGGFLNQNERAKAGMLRELIEETGIKVPKATLEQSIFLADVFDHPERSLRGRTITHAFLIKLNDSRPLPKVKGSDDAATAEWIPLAELQRLRAEFFEDHFDVIQSMISRIKN